MNLAVARLISCLNKANFDKILTQPNKIVCQTDQLKADCIRSIDINPVVSSEVA